MRGIQLYFVACALLLSGPAAAGPLAAGHPALLGIPLEFLLFAALLFGIAVFHDHTLPIAVGGLLVTVSYELAIAGLKSGPGLAGLGTHFAHEWVTLANLFLLLMGFALLARHVEQSHLPDAMPALLPAGTLGGVTLLVAVFVLSAFLDNIAAALIGGTIARTVFSGRVGVGYLAAIVAASNAGGAGSVVGDTTTTMMWIAGVSPLSVFEAYLGAVVALAIVAVPAARAQQRYAPLRTPGNDNAPTLDHVRIALVAAILLFAVGSNVVANLYFKRVLETIPVIGVAVWLALLATAPWRHPDWRILPETLKGTLFLLALVATASLMPVDRLPAATWATAFGLGGISAVFDNIPLTALALKQGGYDWGFLAYAVGFGGSMMWFGSSAGVALATQFPQARSAGAWLREGWPIALGYVAGYAVMLAVIGWRPDVSP